MGCICSKGATSSTRPKRVKKEKKKKGSSKRFLASSREEAVGEVDIGANDATARLINVEKSGGSSPPPLEEREREREREISSVGPVGVEEQIEPQITGKGSISGGGVRQVSRVLSVQNGVDGAQVVAGWPSWLTAVAGEAIKGWVPRKADSYEKLEKIGQGTYSSVYRARDLETQKFVALKKVRFVNMDPESVRFMAREILILRRLDHPNVMKLEGLVISRGNLYLVFEYMEHDLAGLAASPKIKFSESQIKCYMKQLLLGLEHCHSRGVLHRDIKGSNLLIDNNGNLKIGDFGLATFFHSNHRQPLTSRVVTLWYRPPELLLGATDYGPSVDLWSSGCILAELFFGKPIMPGRTEVEQLHKIYKLVGSPSEEYWKKSKLPHATIFKPQNPYKRDVAETFKDFPPSALTMLDSLLAFEPERRGSASAALQSQFFTTKPYACDPSTLPKYPPTKELDAKLRDEEARSRHKAAGSKSRGHESLRKTSKESKAIPAPDANAELPASMQKWKSQSNQKSSSEKFNPGEEGGSGFPMEPAGRSFTNGHLGLNGLNGVDSRVQRHNKGQGAAAQLSRFSNSVASGGGSYLDLSRGDHSAHSQWNGHQSSNYDRLNDTGLSHHLLGGMSSSHKKEEPRKDSKVGNGMKKSRIHYSGPLLPNGGNMEEMLREHERQIQQAVRNAREKNKNKHVKVNGQTDSLLQYVGSNR